MRNLDQEREIGVGLDLGAFFSFSCSFLSPLSRTQKKQQQQAPHPLPWSPTASNCTLPLGPLPLILCTQTLGEPPLHDIVQHPHPPIYINAYPLPLHPSSSPAETPISTPLSCSNPNQEIQPFPFILSPLFLFITEPPSSFLHPFFDLVGETPEHRRGAMEVRSS